MAEIRYSQVELNRCAFLHDGAIESQCIATEPLENGMIVAVDKATGTVKKAGESAEAGMVYGINYTSERIYNQFTPGRKNFRVEKDEYPRVGILKTGDIFTTDAEVNNVGEVLKFKEVCKTTNPDGSEATKYIVL